MDDAACLSFFLQPAQTLHRQYEALRAVFVDRQPLPQVARQFGYQHGSLRNLVTDFRAQCRSGQAPPFSPRRVGGGRAAAGSTGSSRGRRSRPPPTAAS